MECVNSYIIFIAAVQFYFIFFFVVVLKTETFELSSEASELTSGLLTAN